MSTEITPPNAPSELAMAQAHAAEVRAELEAQRTPINAPSNPPRTDPPRAPSTTLSPATPPNTRAELARAAEIARTTGSPRSLIEYLRLRRSAAD